MGMWVRLGLLLAFAGLVLVTAWGANASPGITERVSVDSAGAEGDGASEYPAISADGRYVVFDSLAGNLVSGDTNGCQDVFVHDRLTGGTERVSVATGGGQGSRGSLHPAISADGRYVAFDSWAPDLVAEDTNDRVDVFVRDRQTNTTERVSLSSTEVEGNDTSWYSAISSDGRFVAFESFASNLVSDDTNNAEDVFVRDRQAGTTTMVSLSSGGVQGNSGSWDATISGDGRFVAFDSDASNLVTGDTNGHGDVFVRDRDTDADGIFDEEGAVSTTRVSVGSGGVQGNDESYYAAISGDGRSVAFASAAANLVTGDTNGFFDVFVRDRQTATTTRVSLDSGDGEGDAGSFAPAISADGRYVAFQSFATNLVVGDTNAFCDTDGDDEYDDNCPDVFLRDRDTDEDGIFDEAGQVSTTRVSVDSAGAEGNGESLDAAVSGDGRYVAFYSFASDLVSGDNALCDSNGDTVPDYNCQDVFVHNAFGTVGGIAELPESARDSGRPEIDRALLAGLAAAALALVAAGVWYTGKRLKQG